VLAAHIFFCLFVVFSCISVLFFFFFIFDGFFLLRLFFFFFSFVRLIIFFWDRLMPRLPFF